MKICNKSELESRLAAIDLACAPYTDDIKAIDIAYDRHDYPPDHDEALERVRRVERRMYFAATGFSGPPCAFRRLYIRSAIHDVVRSYTLGEQPSPEGVRISPDPETMIGELEEWVSAISDVY